MLNSEKDCNRRPLKIAMIGHKRIPGREGGVEIVVQEISERLVRRGHDVVAYNRGGHHVSGIENETVDYDTITEYNGVKIKRVKTIDRVGASVITYTIRASIDVLRGNYDVVMYHAEGPCLMCWLPKLFGIPVIAENHGLDWQREKWGGFASRVIKLGEKMSVRHSKRLIVLSKHAKEYFYDKYHKDTVMIPNGVNAVDKKEANLIKDKWGLERDGYILCLCRLVPEKGVHYLIDAYKKLQVEKMCMPKLVIAGGGAGTEGYERELKDMSRDNQDILFTGFVQGELLAELYSNAYLYVLPSDVEGMPLSLLEAMSYGCACLTSDISECIDVTGEYGLKFKKGNVESLKERLRYCVDNKDVIKDLQAKSVDYILEKHNWEISVDKIENLMYEVTK